MTSHDKIMTTMAISYSSKISKRRLTRNMNTTNTGLKLIFDYQRKFDFSVPTLRKTFYHIKAILVDFCGASTSKQLIQVAR